MSRWCTVHDQSRLQEKLIKFQKEVAKLFGLQEEANAHGTPHVVVVQVSKLQTSLEAKEKTIEEAKATSAGLAS